MTHMATRCGGWGGATKRDSPSPRRWRWDPNNGVAVINAASAEADLRNYDEAAVLYKRAQTLHLPDSVKRNAFARRIAGASNTGDCEVARSVLMEARKSAVYDALQFVHSEAAVMARCDYEEARGTALLAPYAAMASRRRACRQRTFLNAIFSP